MSSTSRPSSSGRSIQLHLPAPTLNSQPLSCLTDYWHGGDFTTRHMDKVPCLPTRNSTSTPPDPTVDRILRSLPDLEWLTSEVLCSTAEWIRLLAAKRDHQVRTDASSNHDNDRRNCHNEEKRCRVEEGG